MGAMLVERVQSGLTELPPSWDQLFSALSCRDPRCTVLTVDYMAVRVGVSYLDASRARREVQDDTSLLDDALRRHAAPLVWLEAGKPRDVLVRCWSEGVPPSRIRKILMDEVPEAVFETVRAL